MIMPNGFSPLTVLSDGAPETVLVPTSTPDGRFPFALARGENILRHEVIKSVEVQRFDGRRWVLTAQLSSLSIGIFLTPQRLVVHCHKYEKGGGWVGDPVSMLAFNAISKMAAAQRRRGKVLLGHLRHEWISELILVSNRVTMVYQDHVSSASLTVITGSDAAASELASATLQAILSRRSANVPPEPPPIRSGGTPFGLPGAVVVPSC